MVFVKTLNGHTVEQIYKIFSNFKGYTLKNLTFLFKKIFSSLFSPPPLITLPYYYM